MCALFLPKNKMNNCTEAFILSGKFGARSHRKFDHSCSFLRTGTVHMWYRYNFRVLSSLFDTYVATYYFPTKAKTCEIPSCSLNLRCPEPEKMYFRFLNLWEFSLVFLPQALRQIYLLKAEKFAVNKPTGQEDRTGFK